MLTKRKIEETAESLSWNVKWYDLNTRHPAVEFETSTTLGQDLIVRIDFTKFSAITQKVYDYYLSFDVDYETSLWIGNDGHGKNGAPYKIVDIVHDMEEAEKMILRLSEKLEENE